MVADFLSVRSNVCRNKEEIGTSVEILVFGKFGLLVPF